MNYIPSTGVPANAIWTVEKEDDNSVIAYCGSNHKVTICNDHLARTIQLNGITVPASRAHEFNGARTVNISDPAFPEAFQKYYYPQHLSKIGCVWNQAFSQDK